MWPFRRAEERADIDATDAVVASILASAAGIRADPLALFAAEAAIGLWERSISTATVRPDSFALRSVTAPVLALIGRQLATTGNAVFGLDVGDGGLSLAPCAGWDIRGGPEPEGWRYRLDYAAPSRVLTVDRPAAAVAHFRVGAGASTPWRGRSPLQRSPAGASLAAAVEAHMTAEARLPVGRLVPLAGQLDQLKAIGEKIKEGGLSIVGTGQGPGIEQVPAARYAPQGYGANPTATMEALRTSVGREIAAAFGISPGLFAATGDGAGQREAWRRFWISTAAPIGRAIEAEIRAKIDSSATVEFKALRASDEDGRSRAVSRRAAAAKTLADMGIERGRALRLAGLSE